MNCNLYKGVANRNSGIREITKNHIRKRKEGKMPKLLKYIIIIALILIAIFAILKFTNKEKG